MKAQHALGLSLAWRRVILVFLIDVAILVLASHWPGDVRYVRTVWWSGVGVAAALTLFALGSYHRVPFSSALAARVLDRFADPGWPRPAEEETDTRAVDHRRRYGRETVGIREHRGQLVAVIAVGGRLAASAAAGRHHRGTATPVTLPVELVASALRQFDVELDGIDIVSASAGGTRSAASDDEDETVDAPDRPADLESHRSTWLVLRMDPLHNVAAMAARDSVAATLAAAAERLVHDLDGRHVTARVVTADEFAAVETAVLAGLQSRRPKQPKQPKQYVASFWVSPRDITSENLERLWLAHADATVVTIQLTPRRDRTEVSVLVRYHSGEKLPKDQRAGLNRFIGRRRAAVYPSLPMPAQRPALVPPAREFGGDEQLVLALDPLEQAPAVRTGAAS